MATIRLLNFSEQQLKNRGTVGTSLIQAVSTTNLRDYYLNSIRIEVPAHLTTKGAVVVQQHRFYYESGVCKMEPSLILNSVNENVYLQLQTENNSPQITVDIEYQ